MEVVRKEHNILRAEYGNLHEKLSVLYNKKDLIEAKLNPKDKIAVKKIVSIGVTKDIDFWETNPTVTTEKVFSVSNDAKTPKVKKSDYKSVCKKIKTKTEKMNKLEKKLNSVKEKLDSGEQEITESRMLIEILQSQIKELGTQINGEVFKVYKEAGNRLRNESNLSIDMYNF